MQILLTFCAKCRFGYLKTNLSFADTEYGSCEEEGHIGDTFEITRIFFSGEEGDISTSLHLFSIKSCPWKTRFHFIKYLRISQNIQWWYFNKSSQKETTKKEGKIINMWGQTKIWKSQRNAEILQKRLRALQCESWI